MSSAPYMEPIAHWCSWLGLKNPNAATWAEKIDAEQQYEQTRQLKEKVQKLHDDDAKEDGTGLSAEELEAKSKDYDSRLSGYEKEFHHQTEDRTATLSPRTDNR